MMGEELGRIERAEVVDDSLIIVVRFDSLEKTQKAAQIMENIDRHLARMWDDRIEIGLATKDFYDGP